ncbi:MAG: hypothetical protein AABW67_04230 [Nanoarchaeota archaeon]
MKQSTKDILIIFFQFIFGGIFWILIGNSDNGLLIGKVIYLDKAGSIISKGFAWIGIIFILLLILICSLRKIYLWKKRKYY